MNCIILPCSWDALSATGGFDDYYVSSFVEWGRGPFCFRNHLVVDGCCYAFLWKACFGDEGREGGGLGLLGGVVDLDFHIGAFFLSGGNALDTVADTL